MCTFITNHFYPSKNAFSFNFQSRYFGFYQNITFQLTSQGFRLNQLYRNALQSVVRSLSHKLTIRSRLFEDKATMAMLMQLTNGNMKSHILFKGVKHKLITQIGLSISQIFLKTFDTNIFALNLLKKYITNVVQVRMILKKYVI